MTQEAFVERMSTKVLTSTRMVFPISNRKKKHLRRWFFKRAAHYFDWDQAKCQKEFDRVVAAYNLR